MGAVLASFEKPARTKAIRPDRHVLETLLRSLHRRLKPALNSQAVQADGKAAWLSLLDFPFMRGLQRPYFHFKLDLRVAEQMALMQAQKTREKTWEASGCPYRDLYIYLVKGLIRGNDEIGLGETFLGNWVEDNSSFLFFSSPADKAIAQVLKQRPELELIEEYHFTYEQWQGERLKTFKVDDFVIVPAWEITRPTEAGLEIVLDPGVVFGNGLHPTTRDSLKALAYAARQRPLERMLDLGTGTGILALAAARLGAESVLAIDLNPLCVKTAKKNVEFNRLGEIIHVMQGPAEVFLDEPADLVIANIHWEIIDKLLHEEGFRKRNRLLISGLMRSQRSEVWRRLKGNHYRVFHEWDHETTWFTVLAQRN